MSRALGRAGSALRCLAAAGVLWALGAGVAFAQSAREPLDVPASGWVSTSTGSVPFHAGDLPAAAAPGLDDAEWEGVRLPGLWHRQRDEIPDVAWYRVHLRVPDDRPRALLLPPIYGPWAAYLDGRRIGASGTTEGFGIPSEERAHLIELADLAPGEHVLAVRAARYGRWGGFGGPLRIGTLQSLERHAQVRDLLSAGICILFFGIFLFQCALYVANPLDRSPLWLALACLGGALYLLGTYDFYYLTGLGTELKLRLRIGALLLGHAASLTYAARLLNAPSRWGVGLAVTVAAVGACVTLVGSVGSVQRVFEWLPALTFFCLAWALVQAGRLPSRSPLVRTGTRAGLVGLMLALGYDAWGGLLEVRGSGTFELAFVPFCATVLSALVIEHSIVRAGAARVLNAGRDGITVTDRFGVIRLANPAMADLLGVPAAGLTGLVITARLLGPSRPAVSETIRRLAAGGPAESYEVSLEGSSGPVSAEIQATRLDEERILLSFRDLTDRRRLEAEVARASRLDSLGMLAGGIAHDFNNLLAGILLSASDLRREGEEAGAADPRIVAIAEEARRGGALTERLLQFARGRQSQPVGVDLETAVPDMVELLARTLGRNIEWKIEPAATRSVAAIDEGELEQVLVNLCVNARDAMSPRGGTVVVRMEDVEADQVALIVRDAGRGIPPELLDRVYEPFVTTKGAGAGTGLGLAVVHGIVRRRGGAIDIQSEVGKGTQVRVRLPLFEGAVSAPGAVTTLDPPPPPTALRILLVDDEDTLRKFLTKALERRGQRVTPLCGGREVIDWIDGQGDGPPPVDAVVMDMMMPGVDGSEATRALRERWPGLAVVISSGYTGREDISELQQTGPTEVLRKPYRVEELLAAFSRVTTPEGGVSPRTGS